MIYSVSGTIFSKGANFLVIDTKGVAFKVFVPTALIVHSPGIGNEIKLFTFLHFKEDLIELYGFLTETELELFRSLNNVSGIGPKSALGVLNVGKFEQIIAAINEGRVELLTKASGVGRRTAERVVLELKGKLDIKSSPATLSLMESNIELEETLISLGFSKIQAKSAISAIDPKFTDFKSRLKEALKQPRG